MGVGLFGFKPYVLPFAWGFRDLEMPAVWDFVIQEGSIVT